MLWGASEQAEGAAWRGSWQGEQRQLGDRRGALAESPPAEAGVPIEEWIGGLAERPIGISELVVSTR